MDIECIIADVLDEFGDEIVKYTKQNYFNNHSLCLYS